MEALIPAGFALLLFAVPVIFYVRARATSPRPTAEQSAAGCCEWCGRVVARSAGIDGAFGLSAVTVARRADDINFVEKRTMMVRLCNLCRFKGKIILVPAILFRVFFVLGFPFAVLFAVHLATLAVTKANAGPPGILAWLAAFVAFVVGFPLAGAIHWLVLKVMLLGPRSGAFLKAMKLEYWGITYNLMIE